METDRRGMLTWLGRTLAGLCAAATVLGALRLARPHRVRDLSRRVKVGPAGALPPGSSRYLPEPDVHVIHGSDGAYAVSGRCTHLGCSVLKQPEGFACPCHGARFGLDGKPLSGPAPRPLTWLRIQLDSRRDLWLHLDETVEPGTLVRI